MIDVAVTLNRPEGILYGCRFGCFINDLYKGIYVDDYDIGSAPKMTYFLSVCSTSDSDYEIIYDGNTSVEEYLCRDGESIITITGSTVTVQCYILFNSNTMSNLVINQPSLDGSTINENITTVTYNILDGKIINTDGSIDVDKTELYENVLRDSDDSRYLHNKMKIMNVTFYPAKDFINEMGTLRFTISNPTLSTETLSLKFKDLDGNTMSVSDITSNDVNKNLIIESDRYEDGYYLILDADSTFKYITGDPDRYVPKFNLKWKIPVVDDNYIATNSYFGAFVKDTDGKFICISQPKIYQTDSTPIEHVTFPIEIYSNEDLYHEEDGSIPIYLVRFKGNLVEQDLFKTNMINSVTDFIKTY